MKKTKYSLIILLHFVFILLAFPSSLNAQEDYTLNYNPDGTWSGSFGYWDGPGLNFLEIWDPLSDKFGLGNGSGSTCEPTFICNDNSDPNCAAGSTILPVNQTILICNNNSQSVFILEGPGEGQFICTGNPLFPEENTIYELVTGNCAVLSHDGQVAAVEPVAPIPTLSQWSIIALTIIMLIFGIIAVRKRKIIFGY
jgi:hypothetical protein